MQLRDLYQNQSVMEIVFESTGEFEQDLTTFSSAEQKVILDELHQASPLLLTQKLIQERRLHQFYQFSFTNDYGSSLYSFIVNYYIRVILAIDEDPIFEHTSITLFRVINIHSQDVASAYKQVGELLYKKVPD
ncbi:MAG: hypothetical protein ACRC8A_18560 [Microcoleaceae cyanobacterium]